ncbi:ankyrin repeat protein [Paraburkholderia fungorum]|jgi:ankyrin repeat protein|uniref:ankyrin repeat domain-containing protein n=1 Tax=Paraburkholderia fungorum TaxID=134537 RepID=UPI000D065ACB|nr:ankyrin repeat domain-containing protein [Paraburkholderia fungorum]PRZ56456.1 ankyrin repeat protein [Paraburkholderia fungorum]
MIDFHAAHGVVLPLGTPRAEALTKALKPSLLGKIVGQTSPNLNLSSGGATPLCFAAAHGLIEDVRVMIRHGANPGKLDKKKRSPLHWAAHAVRYDRNAALACVRELAALSPQPIVDAVATGIIEAFKAGDDNRAGPILAELQRFVSSDVAYSIRRLETNARDAHLHTPEMAAFHANRDPEDGSVIDTVPETYFERVATEFGDVYGAPTAPFERLSAIADGSGDRLVIETLSQEQVDTKALKKLLESGASPNAKNAQGQTAMELAVMHGDEARNAVRMLSEHGASVRSISADGENLLVTAWQARAPKIAGILLRRGLDANAADRNGETLLQAVASEPVWDKEDVAAKAKFVEILLENGASAHPEADNLSRSPVVLAILAAEKSRSEPLAVLTTLLAHGGLPQDVAGQARVVEFAIDSGRVDVLRPVIQQGAKVRRSPNRTDNSTVLHRWASRGSGDVQPGGVALLLDAGSALESADSEGDTALIAAARSGNEIVVGELLERGANVEARGFDGRTALFEAVGRGNAEIARLLLDRCDRFSKNEKEALAQAVETGGAAACDFLAASGAPLPAIRRKGDSLLYRAAQNGETGSVAALLDLAAARNGSPWDAGYSTVALEDAMAGGHYDTATVLIDAGANPCFSSAADFEHSPLSRAAAAPTADGLRFLLNKMPSQGDGAPDLNATMAIAAKENASECVAVLIEHGASQRPSTDVDQWPLAIALAWSARAAAEAMLPHCDNKLIAEVLTHSFDSHWPSDYESCVINEDESLRVADSALSRLPNGADRERIERMAIRSMERMGLTGPESQGRYMPFVAAAEEQRSLAAIVKTASAAKSTSADQGAGATVAPTLPALGSLGSLEPAVVVSATAPPAAAPAPKRKGMRL